MTSNSTSLVPKLVQEVSQPDNLLPLDADDPESVGSDLGLPSNTDTETVRREFAPLVVTRLGGTLPWDTSSAQLQCGETVTDATGDMNIRLVYHCVAPKSQFETLVQMRANPNTVKLISNAYSGPVTFDELKFDRIPDANGQVVRGAGERDEPLYKIQLQSKENSESG